MGDPNEDLTSYIRNAASTCHPVGGYCEIRSLALASRLSASKNYIIGIDPVPVGERDVFTFKLAEKAAIKGPFDPSNARGAVRVVAPIAIKPAGAPSTILLQREILKIDPGSLYVEPDAVDIPIIAAVQNPDPNKNVIDFTLGQKLDEGKVHSLRVSQGIVTDSTGLQPVKASGTIELGGAPSNPDAPKISATFSSNAGVGYKAFFDFKLDYKPKNQPLDLLSGATWKPNAAIDIGFRSAKSANSIVLSFVRDNSYLLCRKTLVKTQSEKQAELAEAQRLGINFPPTDECGGDEVVVPDPVLKKGSVITHAYAGWSKTPWSRRSHIGFQWGPKLEADRDFEKVNILGNARFDFVFHRWLGSIGHKRKLILLASDFAADRKAAAGRLQGPFFGFTLVPYISFDVGQRAYSETIKKKVTQQVNGQPVSVETSVVVPEFSIARSTFGLTSTFEWVSFGKIPTTLTLDESMMFLGLRETVGFTTDAGAFLRRVRGFHPNLKTSLDFAIDPGRHYSFNITWNNGRTPPSFEYLNKVTTGLKVIY